MHNLSKTTSAVAAAITLTMLAACGGSGGSGGGDGTGGEPTDSNQDARPAVAEALGENFNTASAAFANLNDDSITGIESQPVVIVDDSTRELLRASLGLEPGTSAEIDSNADTVTIDPDEAALCQNELAIDVADGDQQRCEQLLADIDVQVTGNGDDAGTLTYFFQNTQLLSASFGDNRDSLSVNLGGARLFADALDALDPQQFGETTTPETFEGEITVSAESSNSASGEEAGNLVVAITQALSVAGNGTSFSINPGELLSITSDAGTGLGEISFDIGAISLLGPFRDNDQFSLDMDGFTATAAISADENSPASLTVSNLGIGRGPLAMRINSVDALTLSMETFGFTVQADNGVDGSNPDTSAAITIDRAMDISLMLSNATGLDPDLTAAFTAMLDATAPAGTLLDQALVGSDTLTRVAAGGPFFIGISASDGETSESQSVTVNTGQCLGDAESLTDMNAMVGDEDGEAFTVIDCP